MNFNARIDYCIVTIIYITFSDAYEISPNEPLPKPVNYFTTNLLNQEPSNASERNQDVRFNNQLASTSNVLDGLPMNFLNTGVYPFKIDLGGLLLGAVVGLGALVIIPKLVHLLSSELTGYGQSYHGTPFGRVEKQLPEGISQMMSQITDILDKNNVNSTVCMQKAICSYVQSSIKPVNRNSEVDPLLERLTSNSVVDFLIDGSKFKSAVADGLQGINCGTLYNQCPFTKASIVNGVRQMILNNLNGMINADKTHDNLYDNNNNNNNSYNKDVENNVEF